MSSNPNGTAIACGSNNNSQDDYNKPLHVGALFVIMAVSTLAAIFPLIATRVRRLRVPQKALFVVKHFGTGVLVFVALLLFPFTGILPDIPAQRDRVLPPSTNSIRFTTRPVPRR